MVRNKKCIRIKRATQTRKKIKRLGVCRLVAHRTLKHIYAQIISRDNCNVLAAASTTEKLILEKLQQNSTGNKIAAAMVGELIAQRSLTKGIVKVSFDRSGFKYHGRIQELANGARCAGLIF